MAVVEWEGTHRTEALEGSSRNEGRQEPLSALVWAEPQLLWSQWPSATPCHVTMEGLQDVSF